MSKSDKKPKPFSYRREWGRNPKTQVTPHKKVEPGDECSNCKFVEVDPHACENCPYGAIDDQSERI